MIKKLLNNNCELDRVIFISSWSKNNNNIFNCIGLRTLPSVYNQIKANIGYITFKNMIIRDLSKNFEIPLQYLNKYHKDT
ncbi:hypothetical protein BpHYR1_033008 [Brachionus plicatilis]|uniref:Uncharacterized protein n=1 Tax=Brachionus plicatilis TaxID=10195 RepID=A0A3M7RAZ4_BRAPC|nr:hypothetical protein BpHYR1_033008 [Brachionus plicatilis]